MTKPDYKGFAKTLLDGWPEPMGEQMDGGDLQLVAGRFGLLVSQERTVPCGEYCGCAEYCDTGEVVECYRLHDDLKGENHDQAAET